LSSLFWLILAVTFCIGCIELGLGNPHQPGSGLFPFFCGGALGLLSLANLVQSLSKRQEEPETESAPGRRINLRNIILTLAVLFAFPWLLDLIGLAPALFVFLFILLRFVEPQRWLVVFGGSVAGAILTCLVFQVWLQIQFPRGIFGI
jgi:hypothetical protein